EKKATPKACGTPTPEISLGWRVGLNNKHKMSIYTNETCHEKFLNFTRSGNPRLYFLVPRNRHRWPIADALTIGIRLFQMTTAQPSGTKFSAGLQLGEVRYRLKVVRVISKALTRQ
ncbi:unnamed protein product, partial [Nesidiocoris tenuis]